MDLRPEVFFGSRLEMEHGYEIPPGSAWLDLDLHMDCVGSSGKDHGSRPVEFCPEEDSGYGFEMASSEFETANSEWIPSRHSSTDFAVRFGTRGESVEDAQEATVATEVDRKSATTRHHARAARCLCVDERAASYSHLVIQGFPILMLKNKEKIDHWVCEAVKRMNLEVYGNWKIVLEEKKCFGVITGIRPTSQTLKSRIVTFSRAATEEQGPSGLACTLVSDTQAECLTSPKSVIFGYLRGLGGSKEEFNLRLLQAEDYFGFVPNSCVIAARFIQGYEDGTGKVKWMPQISGYLIGTSDTNLKQLEGRLGLSSTSSLPSTLDVGAFRMELYASLTSFQGAQYLGCDLIAEPYAVFMPVDSQLSNVEIIDILVDNQVLVKEDILAVYQRRNRRRLVGNVKEVAIVSKRGFAEGEAAALLSSGGHGGTITDGYQSAITELIKQREQIMLTDRTSTWITRRKRARSPREVKGEGRVHAPVVAGGIGMTAPAVVNAWSKPLVARSGGGLPTSERSRTNPVPAVSENEELERKIKGMIIEQTETIKQKLEDTDRKFLSIAEPLAKSLETLGDSVKILKESVHKLENRVMEADLATIELARCLVEEKEAHIREQTATQKFFESRLRAVEETLGCRVKMLESVVEKLEEKIKDQDKQMEKAGQTVNDLALQIAEQKEVSLREKEAMKKKVEVEKEAHQREQAAMKKFFETRLRAVEETFSETMTQHEYWLGDHDERVGDISFTMEAFEVRLEPIEQLLIRGPNKSSKEQPAEPKGAGTPPGVSPIKGSGKDLLIIGSTSVGSGTPPGDLSIKGSKSTTVNGPCSVTEKGRPRTAVACNESTQSGFYGCLSKGTKPHD